MLTLIKFGGSLITDKNVEGSFKAETVIQLANEIRNAVAVNPQLRVIIGHGSGSFGHFAAKRHNTIAGVHTPEEWRGFAEVAAAAAELNYLVTRAMRSVGLPIWRVQPSASAVARDGSIYQLETKLLERAIEHGLIPLVYGDVAFDDAHGGTIISTENIFDFLISRMDISRVILLGEVAGVLNQQGRVIPIITAANFVEIQSVLGDSGGTDVTGGMFTKVKGMVDAVTIHPNLTVHILSGLQPRLLGEVLRGAHQHGTTIIAGS